MTSGMFTAIGEPPADPDTDRPVQAPGSEVTELAAGLLVRRPPPSGEHELNNTAAMVFELCDGRRTVTEVAAELAACFALASAPLAEVHACVDGLRRAGILDAKTISSAPERAGSVGSHGRS